MIRRGLLCCALTACATTPPPPAAHTPAPAAPPAPATPVLPPAPPLPAKPSALPDARAPEDNALTPERADLGWKLFFDPRLSADGTMACASCHHPDQAYTSGRAVDVTARGERTTRNTPSLLNLGAQTTFNWDGRASTLEAAAALAWKEQLGAAPDEVSAKLNAVPAYRALFMRAYGAAASDQTVPRALASFLRALTSTASAWDRDQAGEAGAMTAEQLRGQKVFNGAGCANCHSPPLFTDGAFHNVGVGTDPGRKGVTNNPTETGAFKTPSLRDLERTGPYFHDGSVKTADEAVSLMVKGGLKNPHLDADLQKVKLSPPNAAALKAFLRSLTSDPTFSAPPELP